MIYHAADCRREIIDKTTCQKCLQGRMAVLKNRERERVTQDVDLSFDTF